MIVTTNDVCDFHERVIDHDSIVVRGRAVGAQQDRFTDDVRSEEHTSELQSRSDLVCRLLHEKKNALWSWSSGSSHDRPKRFWRAGGTGQTGGDALWGASSVRCAGACAGPDDCPSTRGSVFPDRARAGVVFFFHGTAAAGISTLSLHDALPI